MNLVSNFIGNISPSQFGGQGTASVNFADNGFGDLLNEQLRKLTEQNSSGENLLQLLGMPANYSFDTTNMIDFSETMQEIVEPVNKTIETQPDNNLSNQTQEHDMPSSGVLAFTTNPLDTDFHSNSGLLDFAKKQATGCYNKFAKNIVTDLADFISDIHN